ncbi:DNA polymerase III subunit alpha [Candidatus Vallotia cooleyia]|uniref:DNA polymerase III subunit alpha n=1 Tax=Candidatus Vallotiella adelgis TaxID=1177211 RepID=UPI001D01241E|nr:DNA polymerase III subunit alpha [Candidatus Vallotia cooleyia]UDG82407.1 DNA polymerase III subunit alpha [Candidatus Vallotia cooleyia]
MSDPRFIHLRVHSEFSIVDGIVRLEDAVKRAAEDGQGALALTDLANAFGLVRFYKTACAHGVKPIVGADVWISNRNNRDKPARLLLLVKNQRGYLNLCKLLSCAWLTNQYRGRAEVDFQWLETGLATGLLALSGMQGDIGIALASGNVQAAARHMQRWAAIFPHSFYIELQRIRQPGVEAYLQQVVELAARFGLPVVATHPVQFMTPEDFAAHEARVCISEGDILANPRRAKQFSPDQYFLTQQQMCELFSDIPSALTNTVEIAKRCNLTLQLGKPKLPLFPTPDGMSLNNYLLQLSRAGLERRLEQLFLDATQRKTHSQTYRERLSFECDTIIKMGFPGYFLIVADFINWAKNNGVPVGPGRGSGAGSLVAFALGITDLDPLRYNLLFERFLNPERVSMPDFDIDFCQDGRDRVIQYVKSKYGADSVSQIATFGTMAAKAAVRDIGRVLDLGYNFTDSIAKLIPFKPGRHVTIADAIKEEPQLQERFNNEDEVRQLLELAQRVEGLTRNVGMHAGGVLIAPGKLTDFCPLYAQTDDGSVISQYDKDDVEAVGLLKFDFLGLTTLTILDWAERYIRKLNPSKQNWSLAQIPLDDPASFMILKNANTVAVFQLESRGMQGMLKDAQPDCFEEIIALVALYRPGPMDLIPSFCARKHGREKVEYPDPRVEPILKETYGIMVYQEQVMQMAQIIGGYSLGSADLLRRAMGKKKIEEMAKHRELFREGAAKNGLSAEKADEIFNLMEKFAGYGFNKSHAAAYALLAYYTAWLKVHYPAEFMAANMSLAMYDTDKVKILFEDCIANHLAMQPPDINQSAYRFEPVADTLGNRAKTIRYGLGAIKGTGQNAIEEILRARESRAFSNLFDFCERVDRRTVNRRTIEALIRAGAFDALQENRAQLLASVPMAIEFAEQASTNTLQGGLFDMLDGSRGYQYKLVDEPAWTGQRKLQEEKTALGFCISGHLFDAYKVEIRCFVYQKIGDLKDGRDKVIAGIITAMRTQMTQRGKILFAVLDDSTGQCEAIVFNELYAANQAIFKEDELLVVQGQARNDSFTGKIRFTVDTAMDLERARSCYADSILLSINGNSDPRRLRDLLEPYRIELAPQSKQIPTVTDNADRSHNSSDLSRDLAGGGDNRYSNNNAHSRKKSVGLKIKIRYRGIGAQCESTLGNTWCVRSSDKLLNLLRAEFGADAVEIQYSKLTRKN